MKTAIAIIAAASFAATAVQAQQVESKSETVVVAQKQAQLPPSGLNNPAVQFIVLGGISLIAVAAAVAFDNDDDNNSTNGSGGN